AAAFDRDGRAEGADQPEPAAGVGVLGPVDAELLVRDAELERRYVGPHHGGHEMPWGVAPGPGACRALLSTPSCSCHRPSLAGFHRTWAPLPLAVSSRQVDNRTMLSVHCPRPGSNVLLTERHITALDTADRQMTVHWV